MRMTWRWWLKTRRVKGMIKVLEKYVEKRLKMNVEKTKMIKCRKWEGR